jgi:RHS repeat-associated protein
MKKIIIPISALFVVGLFNAQTTTPSATENYIYTKTYLDYDANNQATKTSESVQYFDGLGRPKQVVNIKASPANKDVVTKIEYDSFGRQTLDYLPVPQTGTQNGVIYDNPLANVPSTPYGSEKIYSEKQLENSPLDRILSQKQVGIAWNDKPVQFGYDVNIDGEVKKYTTTFNYSTFESTIPVSTTYGANQLYKNTVTDEDGNTTIEFKNGKGQVVLVRKMLNATESANTYYVYNDYDQLAYVIPPLASVLVSLDQTTLDTLCYQYKYDGRNRLVEKKLPGKGWEYMVYDKADRLVLTQDTKMNAQGKWLFTKYDQYSRPIYTGILDSPPGRVQQVAAVESMGLNNEIRTAAGFNNIGLDVYYTNSTAYPTSNFVLLSVNYYDTYPTGTPAFTPTIPNQSAVLTDTMSSEFNTKSLALTSYVKNIEDDNWTKAYSYYDTRGRVIGVYSINHLGGYTQTESKLDFAGLAQQTITHHKRLSSDTERMITESFEYDAQNRLKVHKHKVDNNTQEEILAQNYYNELSQLTSKLVGGTNTGSGLQEVSYQYNIRGWMTKINDPANLGTTDLFGYKINYNQVEGMENPHSGYMDLKVKPKFNGNIAEVSWMTATTPNDNLRRYGYVYDGLNRLQAGFYQKDNNPSAREYFEKIDYDLNGNISHLQRSGALLQNYSITEAFDDLTYHYENNNTSNRLSTVTDSSVNYGGYPETAGNTISYDLNGNMTSHVDKGILGIDYNYLNLPKYILFQEGLSTRTGIIRNNTSYLYRADGVKLKKVYKYAPYNPLGTLTELTTETTEYLDGFQYTGGLQFGIKGSTSFRTDLVFYPTAEGYYDFVENRYIYNYTDHLGNVRLSYFKNGSEIKVLEENNYYPFGLKHEGYNPTIGNSAYQYKYNGKELQTDSGMYDYGARFYMPDLGRWGVVDPLAETSRRWSPYTYAFNNPIRFIDPDGMQNEDVIRIMNNGHIQRTPDENPYDTVTNESGSESIEIARTNITDEKPNGDSQIEESKTIPYITPGHDGIPGGTEYTYLKIDNDDVAKQFFEFAGKYTGVEFARDRISFSDGFSSNIIGTNHSPNESTSAYNVLPYLNLGGKSFHIMNKASGIDFDHSHPLDSNIAPSNFNASFRGGTIPKFERIVGDGGDTGVAESNRLKKGIFTSFHVFSSWRYPKPGGNGYIKYDDKNATYVGPNK